MHNFLGGTIATIGFILGSPIAMANSVRTLTPIELTPSFQYPNGITHTSDGALYVGSVTAGQILKITPAGKIETFYPGSDDLFAATSLRLDEARGILWGTSPDFLGTRSPSGEIVRRPPRIFAIDTRTGNLLQVIAMPEGGFSNDLALDEQGGVYLTDSTRPRIHYLPPGASKFQVWVENDQFRAKEIGLAGIARHSSGVLVVTLFSDGKLFKVTPQASGNPQVEPISLPRKLENPDGIQFAPDGTLLVTEGAIASGNGRLLRIDVLTSGTKPKPIEVLADDLESPVNLTVSGNTVWVTEARIRHRLLPGKETQVPDRFFVRRFRL